MIRRGLSVVFVCLALVASCDALPLRAETKPDNLVVYGAGFVFSAKEPQGWHGDTEKAGSYSANAIFYPSGESPEQSPVVRVLLVGKTDENIARDLAVDMDGYRVKHPSVKFLNFAAPHPIYRVVSKLFAVPDVSFEYVAYINPGLSKKLMFSVSMNTQEHEATAAELAAFRSVVASLVMMQ